MSRHEYIPTETADAIYDLLVAKLGAPPSMRDDFVFHARSPYPQGLEYRFQGKLGFGGKFYSDGGTWRVGYYPEHQTKELNAAVADVNAMLKRLRDAALVRAPGADHG